MSDETTELVLGKFKIVGEVIPTNELGDPQPALEIGSVQEVPTIIGEQWVASGTAERVEKVAPVAEAV